MDISIFRFIGVALIIVGLVLVSNPELVSNKPIPSDTFEAVERRIWWGLLIGFGFLLLFHHQIQPWITTIAATLSSLFFGLLVARLIGIMLDGSVAKQWLNIGIEIVILVPLVWWYFRVRT
ncbi:hypothetical protein GCM10009133_19490 [Cocleimonas flava]|uniref:DUF4345 domain-containing protein n=1 Tax=Cocleimonas flava TaxID=634765 RepID=A0A4R1EUE4_9GAMM|nr:MULTISPECIES: DUF4345 family protein [Cocleimonas]MEB8433806.1 hypothetical protein [Cocleimonas sp. KMM 6892]MEC4716617.1 hypothetical protein [Cocleimonas sp. KMM 6895]MEC4746228.1 hypothetical protein [Cocleimonas sp. KMM 6896]TCJ84873.1 hypothetical protein EV695_2836 [Cocleimonas flava]